MQPKEKVEFFDEYKKEIDFLCQGGNPLEFVYAADVVVGMTSILMSEAALLKKPTLSIIPRYIETEWLSSIGMGITPFVYKKKDITPFLKKILAKPQTFISKVNKLEVFNTSTEDIIDLILNIYRKSFR